MEFSGLLRAAVQPAREERDWGGVGFGEWREEIWARVGGVLYYLRAFQWNPPVKGNPASLEKNGAIVMWVTFPSETKTEDTQKKKTENPGRNGDQGF